MLGGKKSKHFTKSVSDKRSTTRTIWYLKNVLPLKTKSCTLRQSLRVPLSLNVSMYSTKKQPVANV